MADIIQFRRGLASLWTSTNPTLADGELGIESDTLKEKVGNGVDDWNTLPYRGLSVANDSIGLLELKDEVKNLLYMKRVDMGATNVIDWTNPNFTFLRNDLTSNITITDSNLPQGLNTKEITLKINIKSYAIDFPIYYNHMGGDWEEDVINTILIQCENGNSGSEVVNYWVNPKTV